MKQLIKVIRGKKDHLDLAGLAEVIEKGYVGTSADLKEIKKVSFAPSGVAYGNGTCPRYWYYAFEGHEGQSVVTAGDVANMSNGTMAHERIQKALEQAGILVDCEKELKLIDPPIRGFMDAAIKWNDEYIPVEIKTARDESWLSRQASMKPPSYHLVQLLIYMDITDSKTGIFLYENKNTHEILLMPIYMSETNKAILENLYNWLKEVKKAADDKQIPERPFTKRSKICKNCPFNNLCWTDSENGVLSISPLEVS